METRPMTEMEERLMTRFMQADGERNEANRERDAARAERDDAKEWVHHATRMANERDEAQAERDDLAYALGQLERLVTAVAGDESTEARYGSLWSDLRKAAAEARKVLAAVEDGHQ